MKALRMLARAIRDACKSVVRNFPLSLASISCITITLIIVASALIISYNVENFTKAIEKDMTIVAFLNNKADEDAVKQAEKEIDHIVNRLIDTANARGGIDNIAVIIAKKYEVSKEC